MSTRGFWGLISITYHYAGVVAPLRRELKALVGAAEANTLLSNVSQQVDRPGGELLSSLGPVAALSRVARGELSRQEYLEAFGHRGPYEAEFAAPRPAEDPAWLDEQLVALARSGENVDHLLAAQRAAFASAWERFAQRYPDKAPAFQKHLATAARAVRQREDTRSETTRLLWVGRDWALRAGELLGIGEEVFFLLLEEVQALLADQSAPIDQAVIDSIPIRKAAYEHYRSLPPYPTIISGPFDPDAWAADPGHPADIYDGHYPRGIIPSRQRPGGVIKGIPGSGGVVEGRVRRIDQVEEGHLLQAGEVLVTSLTNVGWTLLFPRLSAVVTDVGAPLSHAAIVARELGIPAVVGCGDATQRLQTGDRVRVDGNRGEVELIDRCND